MNATGHAPAAARNATDPSGAESDPDGLVAQRALIALVRGDGETSALSDLTPVQWTRFTQEATRHYIMGLTYRLLSRLPEDHRAPQRITDRLREGCIATALRNAILVRHTSQMVRALAAHDIPVMLLKGLHLARYVYDEPGMRNMADVDIMVPRHRLADAERIFLEHGYGPLPRPDIEEFCTWSNHLAKLNKQGAPEFEVHWSIERPTSPFRIDLDGLWARSGQAMLEDAPVHLLAVEDLLIHLVLHSSYHHRFDRSALKGLVDIHFVILRHHADIDWQTLANRAVEWGASGFLYSTLRLTAELLGTPIPADTLHALPHEPEDEAVIEVARRYILMPGQELPKVYVMLASSQSLRERIGLVMRHTFLPRSTMERVYGLPPGSTWIWPLYAHRVGKLLLKRGSLSVRALLRTGTMRVPIDREKQRLRIEGWVKDLPGAGRPG